MSHLKVSYQQLKHNLPTLYFFPKKVKSNFCKLKRWSDFSIFYQCNWGLAISHFFYLEASIVEKSQFLFWCFVSSLTNKTALKRYIMWKSLRSSTECTKIRKYFSWLLTFFWNCLAAFIFSIMILWLKGDRLKELVASRAKQIHHKALEDHKAKGILLERFHLLTELSRVWCWNC